MYVSLIYSFMCYTCNSPPSTMKDWSPANLRFKRFMIGIGARRRKCSCERKNPKLISNTQSHPPSPPLIHTHLSLPTSTMSASMRAYLAEKYMTGPKADAILARTTATKKKKRKANTANSTGSGSGAGPSGFVIDDDASWVAPPEDEEEDDIEDAVVVKDRSFKRRKLDPSGGQSGTAKSDSGEGGSGWTTIQEGVARDDGSPPPTIDELPQIAGVVEDAPPTVSGGLLTKAQLRKKLGPKSSGKEKRAEEAEENARQQETVYRDASGRKIDMKAEKAEAARRKREAEEKEAKKMEWGKGMAQREEKERERAMMEKERHKGFARHADDADLNEEQKAKELWNDPAAAFLTVRPVCYLFAQISDDPHRRNGARAHGDRSTQARHLRRTDSGSNPDTGGTEWTEATASRGNTFNARTNGNGKGPKVIRGALMTCNGSICPFIYAAVRCESFRLDVLFTQPLKWQIRIQIGR